MARGLLITVLLKKQCENVHDGHLYMDAFRVARIFFVSGFTQF